MPATIKATELECELLLNRLINLISINRDNRRGLQCWVRCTSLKAKKDCIPRSAIAATLNAQKEYILCYKEK